MNRQTRSMIAALSAFLMAATLATGCGQAPSTAIPYRAAKRTALPAAARLAGPAATPVAAQGVGTVVLKLSALQGAGADGVEVKLSGSRLPQPLVKRLSAEELTTSNTVAFEKVPAGQYSVSLGAFNATGQSLGAKSTAVTVTPGGEIGVDLKLKLVPTTASGKLKFDFDLLDGTMPDGATQPMTDAPAPADEGDAEGVLGIEVLDKAVVKKYLLLKRLAVTVKVTNHNATETLSGQVKVEFIGTTGLIKKSTKVVETLTASVSGLAPGESQEITLQSTKSAVDAEATVHTVAGSASAY